MGLQQPERIKTPRVLYLRYPYGQPFGHPHDVDEQGVIVEDALRLLETAEKQGTIVHAPYRWRREDFAGIAAERRR